MKTTYGNLIDFVKNSEFSEEDNILLTGATGFLGGNFLFWKLQTPGKVFVLVRGETLEQARQRIIENLHLCAKSYNIPHLSQQLLDDRLFCIVGDLKETGCGISESQQKILSQYQFSEVWHCAASLSYRWKDKEKIDATNLVGTHHLLEVSRNLQAKRFVYISTAYTAGKQSGLIKEELQPEGIEFGNYYEESKNLAEKMVDKFSQENNMDYTILRPAIIMGPEISQCSGGTRFGLYGFCQEMHQLRHTLSQVKKQLRLVGDLESVGNFIHVDQVVFDMLYLKSSGFGPQAIYHSTNPSNLNLLEAIKQCEKHTGVDCITMVEQREGKISSFESLFDSKTKFYEGYYSTRKEFQRSLPDHKRMTIHDIDNCMRLFVDELKAEEDGCIFEHHQVSSWDGEPLCVHTLGDSQNTPIVIVNAYGMPLDFVTPLARRLSEQHFVITWDTRWVPGLTHDFDLDKCDSLTHAKDLVQILEHFDLTHTALIGWSSGVQVSLRTMAEFPERISSAVLLNGGISLRPEEAINITAFEENLKSLLPKISQNRRMADFYCQLIYGNHNAVGSDQKAIDSILTSTDPYLLYMTSMPFRTPESLFRYANMMTKMFAERDDAYTSDINTPVLVFGCGNDEITHIDVAKALSSQLKHGELIIDQEAGHFAQYYDPKVAIMAADFIQSKQLATQEAL